MELEFISGHLVGLFGLSLTLYQLLKASRLRTYRVKKLRNDLREAILINTETWRLCSQREKFGISDIEAAEKLRSAHSHASGLVRSIFMELSEVDTPFNQKKLDTYVSLGLISSEWLWVQASAFTKKPDSLEKPNLPKTATDWMKFR